MSPAVDTLRRLRAALAGCVVMAAAAAVLGAWAVRRDAEHARAFDEARRQVVEASRRLDAMRDEVDRLDAHAAAHAALVADGRVGAFAKTQQVDRFERAARARRGADGPLVRRYTLRPRAPLPAGVDAGLARHGVAMQPLVFEATVVHEGQFLRTWSAIDEALGGLSAIEGCELRRARTASGSDRAGAGAVTGGTRTDARAAWPRLDASCTIVWYAVEPLAAPATPSAPPPGLAPLTVGGTS